MKELLPGFLQEATRLLDEINGELQTLQQIIAVNTHRSMRDLLRRLHTIKGSAAAFEIEECTRLAHDLETLLETIQAKHLVLNQTILDALDEGVREMRQCLRDVSENSAPTYSNDLEGKLKRLTEIAFAAETAAPDLTLENFVSTDLLSKLNAREIKHLREVLINGENLYSIAADFAFADFEIGFQKVQTTISSIGETVAALTATGTADCLGFNFVFASTLPPDAVATRFEGTIIGKPTPLVLSNSTTANANSQLKTAAETTSFVQVWQVALLAGKQTALELEREVKFEAVGGGIKITVEQGRAVSTMLLHLLKNAVAHGIETSVERIAIGKSVQATVRIEAEENARFIKLRVTDDGRGLDREKIAATAVKKNLIEDAAAVTAESAKSLIFAPGFSTASKVTDAAGRGVGLDAVKQAAAEINGTIGVTSRPNVGTTFEVVFPNS